MSTSISPDPATTCVSCAHCGNFTERAYPCHHCGLWPTRPFFPVTDNEVAHMHQQRRGASAPLVGEAARKRGEG